MGKLKPKPKRPGRTRMIQLRNVPETLHREIKSRAARAGLTMSAYLLNEIREVVDKPTLNEWLDRITSRPIQAAVGRSAAEVVREVREERERYLGERHIK